MEERKLPGLDSNQDKENQKVFSSQPKARSAKGFDNTKISFDAGLRVKQDLPSVSPELQLLIDAWPSLPNALKAGILAMVEAARK